MSARSKTWSFIRGLGSALAVSGAGYVVCDSMGEIATLRNCQQQVLDLAVQHDSLCKELGLPLNVGPLLASSMKVSPSGRLVKCQFSIEGTIRRSDVTATVQRPPYASTFLYNFTGPYKWELLNCHVLIGGDDVLVRAVNLMTVKAGGEREAPLEPLPAHLFHHKGAGKDDSASAS